MQFYHNLSCWVGSGSGSGSGSGCELFTNIFPTIPSAALDTAVISIWDLNVYEPITAPSAFPATAEGKSSGLLNDSPFTL